MGFRFKSAYNRSNFQTQNSSFAMSDEILIAAGKPSSGPLSSKANIEFLKELFAKGKAADVLGAIVRLLFLVQRSFFKFRFSILG